MRRTVIALFLCVAAALEAQDPGRDLMNQGVRAYKEARYADAIAAFEQVANADPGNVNARLYLATAYMTRWTPGLDTPENRDFAARAQREFESVLEKDPNSMVALKSLASMAIYQKRLDDAKAWNERILAVNGNDREAYYSLGLIAWSKVYPELSAARQRLEMRPEDPGPLSDANVRVDSLNRYGPVIEDGMAKLIKALELDPAYDDAMAYMNLLYRARADLRETTQDYQADVTVADQWVQKALDTKRAKAANGGGNDGGLAMMAPPPPSPNGAQRIRVGGNVQAANILQKVQPVYPAEAKAARIQGTVRFQVVIGTDGHIMHLQLISGHPLLVPPSTEAVKQWIYKPTLLNGQPVEVVTQIDVNFTLSE